ncbi:GFA family protein [uncultured Maritalea sp.]|uniref:GFA family protein n=1 Tax=uncultured Maritalea sp. TaxID=757249 RepID=UPI00260D2782|nr:GFA family protein [uncultured Maritalea sp.]
MLTGNCHCGDTGWTLKETPQSATACNCSVCSRYGVLWAYGYIDHDIVALGNTAIYRRSDSGNIDFHFCAKCGCVTHYVRTSAGEDGRHRTAVNLRLTDIAAIADLPIDHFDGHETFKYLPQDARKISDMWF